MGKSGKKGFSLVELSVVLVILGLLTGGILAGRNLIHAAEVNGTMKDMERFITAYQTFRMRYGCIAGDCQKAAQYFPAADPVIESGDGNGYISCQVWASEPSCDAPTNEHIMIIRSLYEAGLISGEAIDLDRGFVKTRLDNCEMNFYRESLYANPDMNTLKVYRALGVSPWNDDCMTPSEAESIDLKMDDGNPSAGMVFGVRAEGSPQTPCNNADRWAPPFTTAAYNVSNDAVECSLYVGFSDF